MKAARFYEKHKMVVEDIPVREPGPNDVLIKVKYCGICGTDVHIYQGEKGSSPVTPPVTLGHEFSGIVVRTGDKVSGLKAGDRVCVDPNSYCGNCEFCATGRKHLCRNMVGIGTAADGGFAEYITVDEKQVYAFGEGLSFETAAMTEPLSCCLHGIDLTEIRGGETVMVVGTGSIGLMMVQLCCLSGASCVIAVEPNDVRREKALRLGADFGINPLKDDTDAVLAAHHITNIDKVIDCAGLISTNEYSIRYAGKGATVMLFGLTGPDDELKVKPFEFFQKELVIKACFVNPDTFSRSLKLLESGRIRTDEIITDIIDLDRIDEAFAQRLYAKNGKVLIRCSE